MGGGGGCGGRVVMEEVRRRRGLVWEAPAAGAGWRELEGVLGLAGTRGKVRAERGEPPVPESVHETRGVHQRVTRGRAPMRPQGRGPTRAPDPRDPKAGTRGKVRLVDGMAQ